MNPSHIIGIGETVFDILFKNNQPQKAVPGGSTFNSIVSLGRAGMNCAMAQRWSQNVCQQLGNNISDELVATLKNERT